MKVIIAGSRSITEAKVVWKAVSVAKSKGLEVTEVVSGGAKGPDTIALNGAKSKGIKWSLFDIPSWLWDVVGKKAGPLRNKAMAEYADALVAIWDGESSGTFDMIRRAHKKGLVMFVFVYTAPDGDEGRRFRRMLPEEVDEMCERTI